MTTNENPAKHTKRTPGTRRTKRTPRGPRPFTPAELQARRDAVPTITYPAQLPVSARKADIAAAIEHNQVVILAGETGSGKTTQLPKICLELGRGITGMIGHTQPRRIAARSVADRICEELGVQLGDAIGYQVRFTEQVSRTTLVKLMTDGILLAETQSDPELRKYDTIIIDEAHERSLNIDFLLGYLANLLPRRPDLKVIITSATIDSQRFAEHFGRHMYGGFPGNEAPIIEVSGRTYPVEIRYRPLYDAAPAADLDRADVREKLSREEAHDQISGIIDAAHELMAEGPGDILVFLSGEGEIRDTAKAFAEELGNRYIEPGGQSSVPGAVEVLTLFARLSGAEQRRIFQSHRHRRIILATNIAETSLTVPGIRYVIDPGTARISRYSNKTKVQRLPIEPISQASANQRSGRSGRVQDGIAIRLYSEEDFTARPEFTEPEIQRTSLASVILQMASMNLGSVEEFPFIDPPDMRAVRAGIQLLEEIGALAPMSATAKGTAIGSGTHLLTDVGRTLSRLPIDPRLGRMLLSASEQGCAGEVLVLVAAMSVQDVRERPAEFKAQADQLHARFTDRTSDFLAYLNLWRYLRTQQRELSGSAFRRTCRAEYLNWLRFREWQDVVVQLREMARPLGMDITPITLPTRAALARAAAEDKDNSHNQDVARAVKELSQSADTPAADQIHRSMLVGLLSNLGSWDERTKDYLGARGTRFVIWPGSGLHRRNPSWVMAAELVETSRLFARTAAQIKPEWVEEVGGHLVRKQHSEPFWSAREGAAMAHEKVTLYGLTVIADRKVLLSKVGTPAARELARELFIRHGLVENQWRAHHAFIKHNAKTIEEAQEVEQRLRQVGLVADEAARFTFFDERIPANIVSGRHFDSWWKRERHKNPELLNFTREFLLGQTSASDTDFPDEWVQGDITLPITYHYSPGKHADGLAIDVPVTLLPQLTDEGFDWLVPGMLPELVVATIRALPKVVRRNLVPAPDVARDILARLPEWESVAHGQPGAPSFRQAFNDAVRALRGVEVTADQWAATDLPSHLEITFRVRSERGAVLDEGTSITELQRKLAPQTRSAVESVVKGAVAQALEEARAQLLAQERPASPQPVGCAPQQRPAPEQEPAALPGVEDNLHTWPESTEELPPMVETMGPRGMTVRGYPAFVEVRSPAGPGVGVGLRILAEPAEQVRDHRLGVVRLLSLDLALPESRITSRWTGEESLTMAAAPYPNTGAVVADLQLAAARNIADRWAAANDKPLGRLRTRADYLLLRNHARDLLEDEVYQLVKVAVRVLRAYGDADAKVRANSSLALINTVTDVREQISGLVYDGFLSATPADRLTHLVRYLQAAAMRIDKAATNPAADDAAAWQVHDVEDALADERQAFAAQSYNAQRAATLTQARWMVEELRVSLFAQQLGTAGKVSPQRIRKLLFASR
ncbi:ATP-dependent RNA helicase HrpA [Trueperella pecoris]|uniref:ATP-dependent RNA helicase HrpA n=1 Tax=Trueperella pecoris TaxID=2733571 RepID=UPI00186B9059|nr:ATP-dependent RNA helicase HrpA [Trueperella pecoris]QOQ39663.1 ATP-dependent RNA helicase HrpA [Trueperella pecoris]QTG75550.1 ATP-dependent RNA helicase HrpA [Trueperella pecoris]